MIINIMMIIILSTRILWKNIGIRVFDQNFIRRLKSKSSTQGSKIKTLSLKQSWQRLKLILVQVQARNSSNNLLNEIGQIAY